MKEQNFTKALDHYNDGLTHLKKLKEDGEGVPAALAERARDLRISTMSNIGLVYLKQQRYEACIRNGTELIMNKDLPQAALGKIRFRRGQAYLALGALEEAREDLMAASSMSPSDTMITKALKELITKYKERAAKEDECTPSSSCSSSEDEEEELHILSGCRGTFERFTPRYPMACSLCNKTAHEHGICGVCRAMACSSCLDKS